MDGLILFVLGIIVAFVFVIVAGSRISLGALLLPKDIQAAARKAAGDSSIVDAQLDAKGHLAITVSGSGGFSQMTAFRRGEVTVSIGWRRTGCPKSGSFAFRTTQSASPADARIRPEVWSHARSVMEATLQTKGFRLAVADETPTLLVRYYAAYDEPIDMLELDRLHGFAADDKRSDHPAESAPVTAVFKQGSLIIDVSKGDTNLLLWRAAAVADVSLEDNLPQKLERVERAVAAMFEGFPPQAAADVS